MEPWSGQQIRIPSTLSFVESGQGPLYSGHSLKIQASALYAWLCSVYSRKSSRGFRISSPTSRAAKGCLWARSWPIGSNLSGSLAGRTTGGRWSSTTCSNGEGRGQRGVVCREGLDRVFLEFSPDYRGEVCIEVCIFLCRFEALAEILWRCRQISKQVRREEQPFGSCVIGKYNLGPTLSIPLWFEL